MRTSWTLILLAVLLATSGQINAQDRVTEQLFFDDFEEEISNDATFLNWTTENLDGWHYWHIVPGGGYGDPQCMRFENNDLSNHDWLISKAISCGDRDSLLLTFDFFYFNSQNKPQLLYTQGYSGNAASCSWIELDYKLGGENEWTHHEILFENPGDEIYLAFRYEADPDDAMYLLLDNVRLSSSWLISFDDCGETKHFKFFSNLEDGTQLAAQLKDTLEFQYKRLCAMWDLPGIEAVFEDDPKTRIYLVDKNLLIQDAPDIPGWKNGLFNLDDQTIHLAMPETPGQIAMYNDLAGLALNTFSQLAILKKFHREGWSSAPAYFLESFGLYESGHRPDRDSVLHYISEHPDLDFNFIQDTSGISNSYKKDMSLLNIEAQLLTGWGYLGVGPGASTFRQYQWPVHIHYFYEAGEDERIKLQRSTPSFDVYAATNDTSHLTEIISWFESSREFYMEHYEFDPGHKFNLLFYANPEIGAAHMVYDSYNGGSGVGVSKVDELSANYNFNADNYYAKYFGYQGMCAHEFMHVFHSHFMWNFPNGFWAEGIADFSQRHSLDWEIPAHSLWKIHELFGSYAEQHPGDLINLEHIFTNPYYELDIYFLGDMFFEYLYRNHGGYVKIREFFNAGMDYSVFGCSYQEVDEAYINFLKDIAGLSNSLETQNDNERIKVYPNPCHNELIISAGAVLQGEYLLQIQDITGASIKSLEFHGSSENVVNMEDMTPGIYLLTIRNGTESKVFKLIKK